MSQYVVPFFYGKAEANKPIHAKNGSAFFEDTGKEVFGITADHVIEKCIECSNEANYTIGLFPVNYSAKPAELLEIKNIGDRIISRSKKRDIATFKVTSDELTKLGVFVVSRWPPDTPETGKGIGFCGFPSDTKNIVTISRTKQLDIVFSIMVFPVMAFATSINEYQITYTFDWKEAVATQGFKLPPADLNLGGMSGGPALAKLITKGGIEIWGPAGVISQGELNYEFGEGRIIAARIDECLGPQGYISRT